MRSISVDLIAHLAQSVTTMAPCFKVVRTDGVTFCFTGHDRDLVIGGDTYRYDISFTVSEMNSKAGLSIDNGELILPFATGGITKADVLANLFYRATLDVFWVNWDDLTQGVMYEGKGWRLGKYKLGENKVSFEVRSLASFLTAPVLDMISPDCPYTFGLDDGIRSFCPADVDSSDSAYRESGSVDSVDESNDQKVFSDASRDEADDYWQYGLVVWTSGNNAGYEMEVEGYTSESAGGQVTLLFNMPYAIEVGDEYEIVRGCDKQFATCQAFGYGDDFGGEPSVPDENTALQYMIK